VGFLPYFYKCFSLFLGGKSMADLTIPFLIIIAVVLFIKRNQSGAEYSAPLWLHVKL
jgi:hypothetical protein